ncbi:Retinol dehydrogenase 14 [Wickerhamomyces ciferrii]|uniref:Retinol dehydrogenase 14 n=1 Tax=Wickerhamomyces ciferrii (strain ATCC 14091 / BCRC 22168 / CBS 111 / JCM 3599 / NBRC 0793 / NRRL Y-1031 F-60-10) TaxID=1206466 RepID=K0KL86_WICCF|nr:Retinol dehydrogenase 14 [Wickerhamomyces ciferrii]CCH42952.1 Retinol dehydrogenase 14 [Wickerhamomyces ciferrii]
MDFNPDELPYVNPNEERRVALVTGGNSGIGWFTVLHLYLHGYVVYIGGRSFTRVSKCIKEIEEEANKRRSAVIEEDLNQRFLGELRFVEIDLLSLKSVEEAAIVMNATEPRIDLLILNAGVMALPYGLTKDNFEIQFQTNYISHFLLTQRILPLIQGRIIFVSSVGHHFEVTPFDRSWTFNYKPNIIFTWFRYAMAKTSGIQYMKLLSLKHPEIHSYSVHPGFVMNTNLFSYWTRLPIFGVFFWLFFQVFGYFFGCSNEEGSYATLKCALSPETLLEENGSYFKFGGKISQPSRVASNINYAASNWVWTVRELRNRGFEDLS